MLRREFLGGVLAAAWTGPAALTSSERLAAAARKQLGVTTGYDPNYSKIAYPGGDVARGDGRLRGRDCAGGTRWAGARPATAGA